MNTTSSKITARWSRLFIILIVLVGVQAVHAAGVVTNCTQADLQAALAEGGSVTIACDGTILLTNTLLIATNTTVDGSGHQVTISGNNAVRVFRVSPGVQLALANLNIVNGRYVGTNGSPPEPGEPALGGGIYSDGGNVAVASCVFSNNSVVGGNGGNAVGGTATPGGGGEGAGGAIYSLGGSLALTNTLMISNSATGGASGVGGVFLGLGGGLARGGAVGFQNATILVSASRLLGNRAKGGLAGATLGGANSGGRAAGGAVGGSGGEVVIENVAFETNSAVGGQSAPDYSHYLGAAGAGDGGAMYLTNLVLDCSATRFVGNVASGGGFGHSVGRGGAMFCAATVRFRECIWESNISTAEAAADFSGSPAEGGAVYSIGSFSASGSLMLSNAARGGEAPGRFSGFDRGGFGRGGGIFSLGSLYLTNCTLAHNRAEGGVGDWTCVSLCTTGFGGDASGGGIYSGAGSGELRHVTISGNSAVPGGVRFEGIGLTNFGMARGGGIYVSNTAVTLRNSIVANSPSGSNCFGAVIDGGSNISSDGSCHFTAPGSLNNTDTKLSPLDDFGGPTLSMALLEGSPALDSANPAACPATDQRGVVRPFGVACDIGAFESAPPYSIRGRVIGWNPAGVTLTLDGSSTNSGSDGRYMFSGLASGNYTVTPGVAGQVFVSASRNLGLGPDAINVDFQSYRSNAFTVERLSRTVSRFVFAGAQSQSYQMLMSSNLPTWTTNGLILTDTNGIFDLFVTNGIAQEPRFLQTIAP